MAGLPTMIQDLALMLIVAGVVTLIFKKLKQPLVLGYIVAGFLVSPHMPYTASVADMENIHLWADIGVMFLLFSLHYLLDVNTWRLCGSCLRVVEDGLCLLGRYACHEFDNDYL